MAQKVDEVQFNIKKVGSNNCGKKMKAASTEIYQQDSTDLKLISGGTQHDADQFYLIHSAL